MPKPRYKVQCKLKYLAVDNFISCKRFIHISFGPGVNKKPLVCPFQDMSVLFRTDSFKTQIDFRQFQKFLRVIDRFGPNRCGKICDEALSHFTNYDVEVINHSHTPESPLY